MRYNRNLILFIILSAAAIIGISCALYATASSPIVALFGALLGAIITLIPFSYINFVTNPDLKIIWNSDNKYNDIHRPSIQIPIKGLEHAGKTVERKHIRVIIKNNGQKVAKSCCGTIQIEEDGRVDGCICFSREPKDLKWVTPFGNNESGRDIYPYGGEQYLEVIFTDNYEPYSPEGADCKVEGNDNKRAPLRAYASTPSAYDEPRRRNQDGFCQGRFNIDLIVYSETAKPCRKKFQLNISDKWMETSMSESDGKK